MASTIRRPGVRQVPLSEIKNDLSRFLREAEGEEIVITRNGKPAGLLIGFASEDIPPGGHVPKQDRADLLHPGSLGGGRGGGEAAHGK